MKHQVVTTALLTMLALAAPLFAQEDPFVSDPENPGCLADHAQERIIAFLELTPDQVADWNVLIEERELAAGPIRDAIRQVQDQIDALLNSPNPDPTELGDLVIARHDLGGQLADVQRAYVQGFVDLLDEEQLERYGFIRHAERAQPVIPAFRIMALLPPHWR